MGASGVQQLSNDLFMVLMFKCLKLRNKIVSDSRIQQLNNIFFFFHFFHRQKSGAKRPAQTMGPPRGIILNPFRTRGSMQPPPSALFLLTHGPMQCFFCFSIRGRAFYAGKFPGKKTGFDNDRLYKHDCRYGQSNKEKN